MIMIKIARRPDCYPFLQGDLIVFRIPAHAGMQSVQYQ